jgi:RimJ/RimL family protein N-acetyltransferase
MRADDAIIRLETRRLEMRRSERDDAEAISAYRSDPAVRRYQGWERTDPDGIRAQIDEMSGRAPGEPGWVQLSVRERESGRLVGDVGLSATSDEPGVIEIGYTIDPAFQGRGYATEAVGALVAYAFDVERVDERAARWWLDASGRDDHTPAEVVAELRRHCHPIPRVVAALDEGFALTPLVRGPYLYRWARAPELRSAEEQLIAAGELPVTGVRIVGTRR